MPRVYQPDGSFDFSRGVNSAAVTTIRSNIAPNGLRRDQLAWLVNATCRGGGILQRTGWQPNVLGVNDGRSLYQGGLQPMYQPLDGSDPYFLLLIGGHVIMANADAKGIVDLSAEFKIFLPANVDQCFWVQAEEFAIVQSGDGVTLPLFWDNVTLRPSIGIKNPTPPQAPGQNEIPAATCMTYYMNRIWYAQGRTFSAGDIVKGPSGTAKYQKRDSILNVTENPLAFGGDGFTIPANDGNIRALRGIPQLQQNLGQGQLHVFTRKKVYSQYVPVSRANWIATGNTAAGATVDMPLQTVVLDSNGSVNDRSLVAVNGDFYYQSLTPAVRSLILGERAYNEPGNVPISRNENRILRFNNRALMRFSSGVEFDNRLLQLVNPQVTTAAQPGSRAQVTHRAAIPLDFDIISNLDEKLPPAWEGHYEGEDLLQLFTGDFGGLERAFSTVVSRVDGSIQIWELTTTSRRENGDNRITWQVEFPAYTWGKDFELKQIHGAEIWVDKEFGEVDVTLEYRPDADPCYKLWGSARFCVARACEEDLQNPVCYPIGPTYREGYCFPITFPKPSEGCAKSNCQKRPSDILFQCQTRLTVKGWMRVRGIILWATFVERGLYEDMNACLPPGDLLKPVLIDP